MKFLRSLAGIALQFLTLQLFNTCNPQSSYCEVLRLLVCKSQIKMKKIVLKLSMEDEKSKKRALKAVAGLQGVESVAVDMKEKKMTVIGKADPVNVTSKLRKFGYAEVLSVGPAKEEKKEAPPKQEAKKEEKKPEAAPTYVYVYRPYENPVFSDENPNACTIS